MKCTDSVSVRSDNILSHQIIKLSLTTSLKDTKSDEELEASVLLRV